MDIALGIIANGRYPNLDMIKNYVECLPDNVTVVSCNVYRINVLTMSSAMKFGLKYCRYPMYKIHEMMKHVDGLVIFFDGENKRILQVVNMARQMNKRITVFDANGQLITNCIDYWF